jgi:NhaA family Na+:H+ antiporter
MSEKLINLQSFKDFARSGQIGGVILLFCVAVSLGIANSGYRIGFENLLAAPLGAFTISAWINDALMAIFFLLVGLEIKREMVEGELSSLKKASLPVIAAMGGMLVPAFIYYLFNNGTETASGWGIPMATDIAFALAIISMLGKHVPASLKVFLAALAIVDDLGAILVIAVFYTNELHVDYLLMAAGVTALLLLLNFLNVKYILAYLIPGILLWYFIHHSGIHATIAGVVLALTLPTNKTALQSPLEKLEHLLNAPVQYFIMPIFALANTNITIRKEMISGLTSPLGLGIVLGLFLGKTIGVMLFSYLAVKLKLGTLPSAAGWKHLIGLGMLAGIGFTMSIFISLLSFTDELYITEAKFAVLCTSIIAGLAGFIYLKSLSRR